MDILIICGGIILGIIVFAIVVTLAYLFRGCGLGYPKSAVSAIATAILGASAYSEYEVSGICLRTVVLGVVAILLLGTTIYFLKNEDEWF